MVKVEVVNEPQYVLTLSQEEAEVLRMILGHTGGNGRDRYISNSIYSALKAAGINRKASSYHDHVEGNLTLLK